MPSTAPPFALNRTTALHLASDLSMAPLAVGEAFWAHRAEEPVLADGRVLMVLDVEETWGRWERHPNGPELVYALSGRVSFHLEDADGARRLDLVAGECGIVPPGTWHRAEIHEVARVLFITPTPARTEERPA